MLSKQREVRNERLYAMKDYQKEKASTILSLYRKIRVSENPYSSILYAVLLSFHLLRFHFIYLLFNPYIKFDNL